VLLAGRIHIDPPSDNRITRVMTFAVSAPPTIIEPPGR